MAISKDEARHIARLANLEFSEAEYDRFTQQINAILDYVAQLNRLDTSAIEATAHVGAASQVLRDDAVRGSIPQDEALENAPERDAGLFKVPRVIG
ncbi:MAG TPA: Asp-tRNA(Asn)/Glu-tRNA(Gln) amidotransferase subunit GatC [Candidatus Polarisedimenticolia bacterium]|nr:Asp-tRNA(Asn)/Glu-tRNA(Gln) amidotransferase subunit GatC [Candidatus Polarisedimenticolia bacterium]